MAGTTSREVEMADADEQVTIATDQTVRDQGQDQEGMEKESVRCKADGVGARDDDAAVAAIAPTAAHAHASVPELSTRHVRSNLDLDLDHHMTDDHPSTASSHPKRNPGAGDASINEQESTGEVHLRAGERADQRPHDVTATDTKSYSADPSIPLPSVETDDPVPRPETETEAEEELMPISSPLLDDPRTLESKISKTRAQSNAGSAAQAEVNGAEEAEVEAEAGDVGKKRDEEKAPLEDTAESRAAKLDLDKERATFQEALDEVSSAVAQHTLRKNWRKFLFETSHEDHIAWILRAGLKNSNLQILSRVARDDSVFKEPLIRAASMKPAVAKIVLEGATPELISTHVRQEVLDLMVEERIRTAPARTLMNWIARNHRLGYSEYDVLNEEDESIMPFQTEEVEAEEDPNHVEMVDREPLLAMQEHTAAAAARQMQYDQHFRAGEAAPLICPSCHRQFRSLSGFEYHTFKKVCGKTPPAGGYKWECENCLQGFTTKQGRAYHYKRHVCTSEDLGEFASGDREDDEQADEKPRGYDSPRSAIGPSTSIPMQMHHGLPSPKDLNLPRPPPPQSFHSYPPNINGFPSEHIRPHVAAPPRPPLHTPTQQPSIPIHGTRKQKPSGDVRQSPSELTPEKRAALDRAIQDVDDKFERDVAAISSDMDEEQRQARLTSLKNGNASKKSQIRRSFGVTLRMREKDKLARKAAEHSVHPIYRPRFESFRASAPSSTHASPAGTPSNVSPPIATGFSPVNRQTVSGSTQQHMVPSQANFGTNVQYNPSAYRPPPQNAAQRVLTPNSHPDTLTHAREAPSPASGFGIMRPQPAGSLNGPYSHSPLGSGLKRRRESTEHERRPGSGPSSRPSSRPTSTGPTGSRLSSFTSGHNSPNMGSQPESFVSKTQFSAQPSGSVMMEVRSEDAANKFTPKNPSSGQAQSKLDAANPNNHISCGRPATPETNGNRNSTDTPMTDVPPATNGYRRSSSNTKETAIVLDSDSDKVEKAAHVEKAAAAAAIAAETTAKEPNGIARKEQDQMANGRPLASKPDSTNKPLEEEHSVINDDRDKIEEVSTPRRTRRSVTNTPGKYGHMARRSG